MSEVERAKLRGTLAEVSRSCLGNPELDR